jgi:deoxyribodipyrimidine photolyase-related protein
VKRLRLILGDQLNECVIFDSNVSKVNDVILMCEVWDEVSYVRHHPKKIALIFSAMRHFAQELREQGFEVDYRFLTDPTNEGSFEKEIQLACQRHLPDQVLLTFPGEWRVWEMFQRLKTKLTVPVLIAENPLFLISVEEFSVWADKRSLFRLEDFYRFMRKKHQVLMEQDGPVGGKWNYDQMNRKPPSGQLTPIKSYHVEPDEITQEVLLLIEERFSDHFGDLKPFSFAVTRKHALEALNLFLKERLSLFGDYQDVMWQDDPWLYHSHLSFYLNCGLLTAWECVQKAQAAYHRGQAPLNAVEGFIRQILGWREYVRGIYWLKMPSYKEENFLEAQRPLPKFYWTGDTSLNCLKQCIKTTKKHAYAHHIQRLMVLGNFALLTGLNPVEVNEWYLIVYADAYEWVELPNVIGMILFADGGLLASKPYAAGGAYIHRMSNYCSFCSYDVKKKLGPGACPFNYLYWFFLMKHQTKLSRNPRLALPYKQIEKFSDEKKRLIQMQSKAFLDQLYPS